MGLIQNKVKESILKLLVVIFVISVMGCSVGPPAVPAETKHVMIEEVHLHDYVKILVKHRHSMSMRQKRKMRRWYHHHYRHHPRVHVEFVVIH